MTTKKKRMTTKAKTEIAVSRERQVMRAVSDLEISLGMAFKLFRNRVANIFDPGSAADPAADVLPPSDPQQTDIDPRYFEHLIPRDVPVPRGRRRASEVIETTNGHGSMNAVDTSGLAPLGAYARLILGVLVRFGRPCSTTLVAHFLGRSVSGSFDTAVAELRRHGYVEGDSSALGVARPPDPSLGLDTTPLPTGQALLGMWLDKLDQCPAAILRTLHAHHPQALSVEDAARLSRKPDGTSYAVTGSFDTAVAKLRKLELIEGRGSGLRLHHLFALALGEKRSS